MISRVVVGPLLSVFLVLFLVTGCTFGGVTPISVAPSPPKRPPALIIGEVQAANPTWSSAPMHFRGRAYDWLVKNLSFDTVLTEPPPEPIAGSITVTGTITELDEGSTALRLFVGMGAGQAQAKGEFRIVGYDGAELVRFQARRSYLGGAGIGGAGFLDMDELVRRLAETVMEMTVNWSRGQPLDGTTTASGESCPPQRGGPESRRRAPGCR
jgi:hypothetical protein